DGDTHREYIVKPGEANKKENSFEM
ncbi:TPA: phage tail protein, partial [Streptococcus pyogenes]